MLELVRTFFAYWYAVLGIIAASLQPHESLSAFMSQYTDELLVFVPGVAFVAGASLLLGQSVILFLNRVGPWRFVLSLALHGAVFALGLLLTGTILWIAGSLLFDVRPTLLEMLVYTTLSYAPLALGFLILIPFFGIAVERLLYLWSALLLLTVVRYGFGASIVEALLCVGLAYALRAGFNATLGRPLVAARSAMLRRVIGSDDLRPTPAEIREQVSRSLAGPGSGER